MNLKAKYLNNFWKFVVVSFKIITFDMMQLDLILMIQEKRFKFIGGVATCPFHLKIAYLYVFVGCNDTYHSIILYKFHDDIALELYSRRYI